jgi:hypothetical protein
MVKLRIILILVAGLAGLVASGWADGDVDYTRERYELIVDRAPFGVEAMDDAGAAKSARDSAAANAAAKAAEKELRLCFLLEADGGEIRAGFENKQAKAGDPRSIMLMVGESFRGMKLVSVDVASASATFDRSGSRVTFSLTKPVAAAAPAAPTRAAPPQRRFGSGFRRTRQQAEQKPAAPKLSPEEQAKKREEVRDNLRQYQMEVIRAGMPPLPIPLTQEMDDQLVSEGVLPPDEE